MSLCQTFTEKVLEDLLQKTLDLMNETASAYFDIRKGSLGASRLAKLKYKAKEIALITEAM